MKRIGFLLIVIIGAVILNSSDTYGFFDTNFNFDLNNLDVKSDKYHMDEMDEDTFVNKANELESKVGTEIDFSKYQCSEDNTAYFVNDICLSNDDLKEIMTKVISNVTPNEVENVLNELRAN
ncbi:MAG: hypothetical protein J5892_03355 [Bacilli bacterium]|nr:hypothetical protein [Bacilli bacterium]